MKMEKVKLTQEQAWMIEKHRGAFESLMRKHHMKNCPTYIDELTTQQVGDAYFGGYEVEEKFEVGDWVKDTSTNAVIKIKDRQHRNNLIDPRNTSIRHATPDEIAKEKQRRWWAKHGRDVWELKNGDLLNTGNGILVYDSTYLGEYKFKRTDSGRLVASANISYAQRNYKLACFAEDRKDLESEEE